MVHVVVHLHLHFVLELALLVQELLLLHRFCEVLVVLSQQVHLADVAPRVEAVAHGILSQEAHVLASLEQKQFVDLPLQVFPVEGVREPGEAVEEVESDGLQLPTPAERIDEEHVPREGNHAVVHAVGVLQVDGAVLDVVAGEEKQLSLSVELQGR